MIPRFHGNNPDNSQSRRRKRWRRRRRIQNFHDSDFMMKLLPRDPDAKHEDVDDMTKLMYLHEIRVLYNLVKRMGPGMTRLACSSIDWSGERAFCSADTQRVVGGERCFDGAVDQSFAWQLPLPRLVSLEAKVACILKNTPSQREVMALRAVLAEMTRMIMAHSYEQNDGSDNGSGTQDRVGADGLLQMYGSTSKKSPPSKGQSSNTENLQILNQLRCQA